MVYNLKKKKIVTLINFFLIISLFVISIFFKPNLNLRNQLFFREIIINEKINILNQIMYEDVHQITNLKYILEKFSNSLIRENKKNNIKKCGVEMVKGNFREFRFFNVESNSFSVTIKSNELSEEQIQKCFEELVVKKLNDSYSALVKQEIRKQILKKQFEQNTEFLLKNFDSNSIYSRGITSTSFSTEQKINYLKSINYLIDPNANYQPTDNDNINISNMIYYLVIAAALFILEIIFLLFYNKTKIKKIILNLEKLFFR
jgi:hypothetical protein